MRRLNILNIDRIHVGFGPNGKELLYFLYLYSQLVRNSVHQSSLVKVFRFFFLSLKFKSINSIISVAICINV